MKLTPAQKREMKILRDMYSITTEGYGQRQTLLLRLKEKGLVNNGDTGFNNVFRLTDQGKEYVNTHHL